MPAEAELGAAESHTTAGKATESAVLHFLAITYAVTSSDSAPEDGVIVDENRAYAAVEMTMNENNAYDVRQHQPVYEYIEQ
jgi:hypothetical protein